MAAEPKIAIDILVNCQTGTNALKRFNKELDRTVHGATRATKATNWLSKGLTRFIGAYFGVQTVKGIVETGSRIQLVQKSIEGLTKSTQDWQYIQQQAFKTGTEIEVVAKGYRNFFSSARMAGFDKGGIQSMYSDVLLATRSIGASTQQTEGALLALEQMLSKGTVSMEELRRQLGNAIPGAFEIGAKAMNMTTKEFNAFVKKGELASNVFVPKFIQALKDEYASGFKDIEQTVSVAQIRLSNAWKLLQADIMTGETGKAFASALNTVRELIESPSFKQLIVYLGKLLALIIEIITFVISHLPLILAYLGARGLLGILPKLLAYILSIQMSIFTSTGAVIGLGRASLIAFANMTKGAITFMGALYKILIPLILIEDLIMSMGKALFGWNVNTLTGKLIDDSKRIPANVVNGTAYWYDKNGKMYRAEGWGDVQYELDKKRERVDEMSWLNPLKWWHKYWGINSDTGAFLRYRALHGEYIGNVPSFPQGVPNMLEKTEHNTRSLSVGDINITIQGASDPIATGNTVKNTLSNLFTSENIIRNINWGW